MSQAALDEVAQRNELHRCIVRRPGSLPDAETQSAAIEAIVGAAYLDGDMKAAKRVVQKLGIDI